MSRRAIVLLIVVLLIVSIAPGYGASSVDDFDIEVTPAVDVPDRTKTFQGTDYNIGAIGRVDPGNDISVTVTAPADTAYNVHLYNSEKQFEDSKKRTGDSTLTFSTEGLAAGSYTIAIERSGEFETIHPVVISGYTVDVDAPESIEKPDTISISVSLSTLDGGAIDRVEAVIGNADADTRVVLEGIGDQTYEGSISTSEFADGSYRLYVVVRGTETVEGSNELLAVSDPQDLKVEPEPMTSTTSSDDDTSGGSSGSETTTTMTSTATPSISTTTTKAATTTATTSMVTTTTATTTSITTTSNQTGGGDSGTTMTEEQPSPSQQTADDDTDSNDVIAPNVNTTASDAGTTGAAGALFGPFQLLAVGFVCLFFATRLRW